MHGRNVVSWTACFEWWRRGERVISNVVDDLVEIVKWEADCWEAGVKMSRTAWKCIIHLKNANTDIGPALTSAAGTPQQHLHRHNMLQWHCGSLLSRTKSSQDMVTSLESSNEGLLIRASTAWRELSLGTFGGRELKCERQKYDLMTRWEQVLQDASTKLNRF